MKETRVAKVNINKKGGTASKNAVGYKITIPTAWAKKMDITEEIRELELEFDGDTITIKRREKTMIKNRIEKMIDEKSKEENIMGSEVCSVSLELTDDEKEEFMDIEWNSHYWWEFEGNELTISYTEELEENKELDLTEIYKEWRKVTEENSDVGEGTTTDAGEAIAREDFSDYAGLEAGISFEEMFELEQEYEG